MICVWCFSWTDSKSLQRLDRCAICCGPIHWRILVTKRILSTLVIIVWGDVHTSTGERQACYPSWVAKVCLWTTVVRNKENLSSSKGAFSARKGHSSAPLPFSALHHSKQVFFCLPSHHASLWLTPSYAILSSEIFIAQELIHCWSFLWSLVIF